MTIRPIPLDGLNRIHQFLLDRRVSGPDPYHDATMSDVKQLAEQIKYQHDEEPGYFCGMCGKRVVGGLCPHLSRGKVDAGVRLLTGDHVGATAAEWDALEIVQLREMVKARDEEISKILNKGEDFVRVSKQDLAELELLGHRCGVKAAQRYTDAIKDRLDENDHRIAELCRRFNQEVFTHRETKAALQKQMELTQSIEADYKKEIARLKEPRLISLDHLKERQVVVAELNALSARVSEGRL
jgi:hypothetical protein